MGALFTPARGIFILLMGKMPSSNTLAAAGASCAMACFGFAYARSSAPDYCTKLCDMVNRRKGGEQSLPQDAVAQPMAIGYSNRPPRPPMLPPGANSRNYPRWAA